MVMAMHWHINRSPEVWKDPLQFHPERFIDANGQLAMSNNLMPFQVRTKFAIRFFKAIMILTFYLKTCGISLFAELIGYVFGVRAF